MPDNSQNNKRIAKNSLYMSIRMVVILLISLYTTRVVLRVLGVVDFGIYNVVCGFVSMFAFLNTSMSNGIQRFFNFEFGRNGEDGANKVFSTAIYIQSILAIIVVVIVEAFGLWYLHNKMVIPAERMIAAEWIFQFALTSFVAGIMQAPFAAVVTAHERFDFFAFVGILDAILKLAIAYMIQIIPADQLLVYGLLYTFISLTNFLLFWGYCKAHFNEIRFSRGLDKGLFMEMLNFSGWNLFGSFNGVMKEQGINLVLNLYFGPVVNAARSVAAQINSGLMNFVGNIALPVRPQIVQSYAKGDVKRVFSLTYTISKLSSYFFMMMAIPLSIEIDFILSLWLGENVPEHANYFTIIVLAISLVNILNSMISSVVHATGIMKDYQLWGSLVGIASVPISYIVFRFSAIPELSLIIVLICTLLGHTIGLFIVNRIIGMKLKDYLYYVVWPILLVMTLSIIIVTLVRLLLDKSIIRLFIIILSSFVSISLSAFYLGLQKNERYTLTQYLKIMFNKINIRLQK